jgi:Phosphoglyceromutase
MTKSPVAIIILDGFGWREDDHGNAVNQANKPNFDRYWNEFPHNTMQASGLAVGLPEGQMGNSEVGHTNIGAGRVVYQSITRIDKAIEDGEFAKNDALLNTFNYVKQNDSTLHLFGLVSDGGVHSHQRQLNALIQEAKKNGIEKIYIHAFTDGRDVAPDSAVNSIKELQEFLAAEGIGEIATVSGRFYAMDRDNRWPRVKRAYDAIYHGEGVKATDPVEAVKNSYKEEFSMNSLLQRLLKKMENLLQLYKIMTQSSSLTSVQTVRFNYHVLYQKKTLMSLI